MNAEGFLVRKNYLTGRKGGEGGVTRHRIAYPVNNACVYGQGSAKAAETTRAAK